MLFRPNIVVAAALLIALAGCGGGGGNNTNQTPTFGNEFPTRFTVFQDSSSGAITYRATDNTLITADAASQLLRSDVVNLGGSTFTVFDMNSQTYNPAGSNGTGRYLITVRNTGTVTSPVLQYGFQDNSNPGTVFPTYTVQPGTTGGNFYNNTYQSIQSYITPGSTVGTATVISNFSHGYLDGG